MDRQLRFVSSDGLTDNFTGTQFNGHRLPPSKNYLGALAYLYPIREGLLIMHNEGCGLFRLQVATVSMCEVLIAAYRTQQSMQGDEIDPWAEAAQTARRRIPSLFSFSRMGAKKWLKNAVKF